MRETKRRKRRKQKSGNRGKKKSRKRRKKKRGKRTQKSRKTKKNRDGQDSPGLRWGSRYLEPGPQSEIDPVQVVIQAGNAPLVHDQLVVVVDADHHQQT